MTKEELIRYLKATMKKHKNDKVDTFGTNISSMCKDVLDYLEQQSIAEERYQDLVEYFSDKDIAKCVLEDREEFKKWLERVRWHTKKVDELARKLEQQPSEDCEYNRGYRDGYDKGNLNGYELRKAEEKKSDDCVSRTQAIEWIENLRQMDKCFGNYEDDYFPLSEVIDRLKNVPPVTPTHGTCKDCRHREGIDLDASFCAKHGNSARNDFYCADYEKRGSENEVD